MDRLKLSILLTFTIVVLILSSTLAAPPDLQDEESDSYEDSEGDDILPDLRPRLVRADGLRDDSFRWPDDTLIYKIDDGDYSDEQLESIETGLNEIRDKTCVKIRKYQSGDEDYVQVVHVDSGCSSHVGRQGGKQTLRLSDDCFLEERKHTSEWGTITHEFIHALGFHHEQCRPDRDQYIHIRWDNIQKKGARNYDKSRGKDVTTYDQDYNYGSIMHYHAKAFAIDKSKNVITPKQKLPKDVFMGQRKKLSEGDIEMINKMYNC